MDKKCGSLVLKLNVDQTLLKAKSLVKKGRLVEAQILYSKVLQAFPENKRAQKELIALNQPEQSTPAEGPPQDTIYQLINLYNQGRLADVVKLSHFLVELYPTEFIVWNILGAASKGLGRMVDATQAFKRVTELNPTYADGFNNLGVALKNQGKTDEAIVSYEKALLLKPDYAEAYNNIGIAVQEKGKLDEAIAYYEKALSFKSDFAEACNNKGIALKDQGKLDEAILSYEKALYLKPEYVDPHYNMGIVNQEQGKLDEAIAFYEKTLLLEPVHAEAHQNLGFALLSNGRLADGLREFEWRWKTAENVYKERQFAKPMWDGRTSLLGKKVLLWCEQGVGDTINWCSRISLISSQADQCILECQEKLVPLFTRSFPDIEVKVQDREKDASRDDFDFHLPMGSLYQHFVSEISANPKPAAFLSPDPVRIEFWRQRLRTLGKGPFIGVSWSSSNMSLKRLPNYAPISDWSPIFKISNVTFVNLQYKNFSDDLSKIQNALGVTVHNFDDLDHFNDLDEVAALCAALDMVVSTKITVPFISAAVGTVTKLANWRQSPWNNILLNPAGPLVEIFERNTWEPWDMVFNAIAKDVINFTAEANAILARGVK